MDQRRASSTFLEGPKSPSSCAISSKARHTSLSFTMRSHTRASRIRAPASRRLIYIVCGCVEDGSVIASTKPKPHHPQRAEQFSSNISSRTASFVPTSRLGVDMHRPLRRTAAPPPARHRPPRVGSSGCPERPLLARVCGPARRAARRRRDGGRWHDGERRGRRRWLLLAAVFLEVLGLRGPGRRAGGPPRPKGSAARGWHGCAMCGWMWGCDDK